MQAPHCEIDHGLHLLTIQAVIPLKDLVQTRTGFEVSKIVATERGAARVSAPHGNARYHVINMYPGAPA